MVQGAKCFKKKDDVLYSVVSQKITKMQEEMIKKQEEIKQEYENKIQLDKETREYNEQDKKRKQEIQQKFMNGTVAVDEYVRLFSLNHGHTPLKDEISKALKNKVDADILSKYLDKYGTEMVNLVIDEEDSIV